MKKVLIVEDEKIIRQGIKVMISRSGVPIEEILECNNGESALEILRKQEIDVMFTDIRMPKMDGIELVKRMQELPDKPLTVVISGYDDFSYAVEMLRTGVREYMLKPIERDAIRTVLEKLEKELNQKEESNQETRKIGCQQLKYLILNENVSEGEIRSIADKFEELLLGGKYLLCCTNEGSSDIEEKDGCLYLGDVEEDYIYIVKENYIEEFPDNTLQGTFIGISEVHCGISELKNAYKEAKTARKYAFCKKKKRVNYHTGLEGKGTSGPADEGYMKKMVQLIGTDRFTEVLKLLEQISISMKRKEENPQFFEENMRAFISAVSEVYVSALTEKQEEIRQFLEIYSFNDIDSYMSEITGFIIALHEKLDSEFGDSKNKQKIKQALIYIGENYDKDLNMAVVSNFVSMNYSLFSYEFKEYTGQNFVTYLKELRLNEAKCLLAETDLQVQEIGRRVGYENEKHFMKTFKSECGVTPTEYRKNMQPAD